MAAALASTPLPLDQVDTSQLSLTPPATVPLDQVDPSLLSASDPNTIPLGAVDPSKLKTEQQHLEGMTPDQLASAAFQEQLKGNFDTKKYEDAAVKRLRELSFVYKDHNNPGTGVIDTLVAAGKPMWEGTKQQAKEALAVFVDYDGERELTPEEVQQRDTKQPLLRIGPFNIGSSGVPEFLLRMKGQPEAERSKHFANLRQASKLQLVRSINMLRRTGEVIANRFMADAQSDSTGTVQLERALALGAPIRTEGGKEAAAAGKLDDVFRQQFRNDVDILAAEHGIQQGIDVGGHKGPSEPEVVETVSQSPLSDPTMFLPAGAGIRAGTKGAGGVTQAVRALETKVAPTLAERATIAAGKAAAKPFDMASRVLAKTGEALDSNPWLKGAAAAGVATVVDDKFDEKALLAGLVGARVRLGALRKAAELTGSAGDVFASRVPPGPIGRFAIGAARVVGSEFKEVAAAQFANTPYLLGGQDEEAFKHTLAGGVLAHEAMNGVGAAYRVAANGLDIGRNLWKERPTTPEVRQQVKDYKVDPTLDLAHRNTVDGLTNSSNNFVQAVRDLVKKRDGGELYALGEQDYGAALDRLAQQGQISSELAGKAKDQQGVTLTLRNEDGTPRRVALSRVSESLPGLSVGHEAGHLLESVLSPEELNLIYQKAREFYGPKQIAEYKSKHEALIDARRGADEPRTNLSEQEVISEIVAEHFSAVLNSIPISRYGEGAPGAHSFARDVYSMVDRALESLGAKQPKLVGEGSVRTGLGIEPSARLGNIVENVIYAKALDRMLPTEEGASTATGRSESAAAKTEGAPAEPVDVRPVPPKAQTPGFKKGDPIGDVRNPDGVIVGENAKVSKDLGDGQVEIEYTHPDSGQRVLGTVPETWLQSAQTPGKVNPEATVYPGHPVTPETPPGAATRAEDIVAPKHVENVAQPQAETPAAPNVRTTTAKQEQFAAPATPEVQAENANTIDAELSKPRHEIGAVETDYYAAKSGVHGPDQITREQQRRLADRAEKEGSPNPLRAIYQKIFVPYKRNKWGVYGFSLDKLIHNVDILRGWFAERGDQVNAEYLGSDKLRADVQTYLENQAHGYGGDGSRLERPADTKPGTITPEDPNYTPRPLDRRTTETINLLMGYELPEKQTPAQEYFRRFAELNGLTPGRLPSGVSDVNSYREFLRSKGFNPRLLNTVVENLRLDRLTTPLKARPDINFKAGDSGIAQAGFMPVERSPLDEAFGRPEEFDSNNSWGFGGARGRRWEKDGVVVKQGVAITRHTDPTKFVTVTVDGKRVFDDVQSKDNIAEAHRIALDALARRQTAAQRQAQKDSFQFMPKPAGALEKAKARKTEDLPPTGWVLPNGTYAGADGLLFNSGDWHGGWLTENGAKHGVAGGEDARFDALKKGFVRTRYDGRTGRMGVEALESKFRGRTKAQVEAVVEANLDRIDHLNVDLLNNKGEVVESRGGPLFRLRGQEKSQAALDFINGEGVGAYMPAPGGNKEYLGAINGDGDVRLVAISRGSDKFHDEFGMRGDRFRYDPATGTITWTDLRNEVTPEARAVAQDHLERKGFPVQRQENWSGQRYAAPYMPASDGPASTDSKELYRPSDLKKRITGGSWGQLVNDAERSIATGPGIEKRRPAPATFRGVQETGLDNFPAFELYDLTEDIPGHPKGSTVSRQTLERAGYHVPAREAFMPAFTKESVERKNPFKGSRIVSGWLTADGDFKWGNALADHEGLAQHLGFKSIEDIRDNHGALRVWADGEERIVTFNADRFSELPRLQRVALEDMAAEHGAALRDDRGNLLSDSAFMPATKGEAPAEFRGVQETGLHDFPPFELYDLTENIPGHPKGSTVSRQTLEKAGYSVPPRSYNRESRYSGFRPARSMLDPRNAEAKKTVEEFNSRDAGSFMPSTPGFYSQLERTLDAIPEHATRQQIEAALRDGVKVKGALVAKPAKAEELRDIKDPTGRSFEDWLKENPEATRTEMLDFVRANKVQVSERVLGANDNIEIRQAGDGSWQLYDRAGARVIAGGYDSRAEARQDIPDIARISGTDLDSTQYPEYVLPGGQNYAETIFTLPKEAELPPKPERVGELASPPPGYSFIHDSNEPNGREWGIIPDAQAHGRSITGNWFETKAEALADLAQYINFQNESEWNRKADEARKSVDGYRSGHFRNVSNYLAHARTNERTSGAAPDRLKDIAERVRVGLNARSIDSLGSGAAEAAVQRGHITEHEAALLSQWKGWRNKYHDSIESSTPRDVLFAEEIQSDLHQEGRRKGYKDPAVDAKIKQLVKERDELNEARRSLVALRSQGFNDTPLYERTTRSLEENDRALAENAARFNELTRQTGTTPDAPFKKSWHEFVFKQLLRKAAESGKEWLAWTTGEQQAARYDLSKQISRVEVQPSRIAGKEVLRAYGLEGSQVMRETIDAGTADSYVGKDVARKLYEAPEKTFFDEANQEPVKYRSIEGLDLKVGGEGMKGFYDEILPRFADKYLKKYGIKTEKLDLGSGEPERDAFRAEAGKTPLDTNVVHAVRITPELRKDILEKGQPLYMPATKGAKQLDAFTGEGVRSALRKPGWAILTATQEKNGAPDHPDNIRANEALEAELKRRGLPYAVVGGSYNGVDQGRNFLVTGVSERTASALGKRFKQESILTNRGYVYQDGSVAPLKHRNTVVGEAAKQQPGYSVLPDGTAFSAGIDWDNRVKPDVRDTPWYKQVSRHLTEQERAGVRRDTAENMQALWEELPADVDFETAVEMGLIKKGWYERAARALREVFGPDTEQFVALLAATSPRQDVKSNLLMALKVWDKWTKAGRPTDVESLRPMFETDVELEARLNNSMRATGADLPVTASKDLTGDAHLSGFKAESFRRNLLNDLSAVTNDTWMALFSDIDQNKFFGTKAGYLAMNAKVRRVAERMGLHPAEVQETVWSFFKTLVESTKEGRTAEQTLANLTEQDIVNTSEFYEQLVNDPQVRVALERLGFNQFDRLVDPAYAGRRERASARPLAAAVADGPKGNRRRVLERIAVQAQKVKNRELEGAAATADPTPGEDPF